ncbi:MAG: hypothetical protein J3R72DRAFT_74240 [Linnemannia gamsii]|nr:MAG: hypothetical protein J3R72DRAFT_74240 [Linnemannia gamsii]
MWRETKASMKEARRPLLEGCRIILFVPLFLAVLCLLSLFFFFVPFLLVLLYNTRRRSTFPSPLSFPSFLPSFLPIASPGPVRSFPYLPLLASHSFFSSPLFSFYTSTPLHTSSFTLPISLSTFSPSFSFGSFPTPIIPQLTGLTSTAMTPLRS